MGGRGLWALRRRNFAADRRELQGVIRNRATMNARAAAGGGGETDTNTTVTLSNGARVTGSEAAIKRALGNEWTLESAALTFGASKGSVVTITASGNEVRSRNVNERNNIASNCRMVRDSQGVTFHGDGLGPARATDTNNMGGRGILPIVKGLREAVNNGSVNRFSTTAAGSAGSRYTGSKFWAEMGASAPLNTIYGLAPRPAALSSARTVAELIQMPGGKTWWSTNRQTFSGKIDFRQKSTPEYKLASKFLGLGRASRRRS